MDLSGVNSDTIFKEYKDNIQLDLNDVSQSCIQEYADNQNISFSLSEHEKSDILIVGAGPAGLTLACILDKLHLSYIIVEKQETPNKISKATGIHRNTMRLLKQLDISDEIIASSVPLDGCINIKDHEIINTISFDQGSIYFDKNISIHQKDFEEIIASKIKNLIRRGVEFKSYEIKNGEVISCVEENNKLKTIVSKFLVGSDGANSIVRNQSNWRYDGITTEEKAFTFDSKVSNINLSNNNMYCFDTNGKRLIVVPLTDHYYKFSGRLYDDNCEITNLENIVQERSDINIITSSVSGLTCDHTKSRLSEKFTYKNVILIGDSAHTFFPAGGYGLNFAIEDAFALGWRLSNNSAAGLIEDYGLERRNLSLMFQDDAITKKLVSENMKTDDKNNSEIQAYIDSTVGIA